MRQGQNSKRSRGRSGGGGGRRNSSPRHQSFDSNGPSIRIRGNANQVYEKYIQLARDANSAGDRVTAENMYQHAEHYFRIMNVEEGDSQQRGQNRGNGSDQRPNQRNAPQDQEEAPAGIEANFLVKAPNAVDDGSGENGAAEPTKENGEVSADSDEPRRERPPRRTRRNGTRQRSEATAPEAPVAEAVAETVEAPAAAEAEPVAEATEADAKEAL